MAALLNSLSIPQYAPAFKDFGIDALTDVKMLDDNDWVSLGVKPLHKKKILMYCNS